MNLIRSSQSYHRYHWPWCWPLFLFVSLYESCIMLLLQKFWSRLEWKSYHIFSQNIRIVTDSSKLLRFVHYNSKTFECMQRIDLWNMIEIHEKFKTSRIWGVILIIVHSFITSVESVVPLWESEALHGSSKDIGPLLPLPIGLGWILILYKHWKLKILELTGFFS